MLNSDDDWKKACTSLRRGDVVSCTVTGHHQFGMLVVLDDIPVWGVIERIGMGKAGYNTPDDYAPVGSRLNATVVGFRDLSRQIELALPPKKLVRQAERKETPLSVEVGVRFQSDGSLEYFGLDDVNSAIDRGMSVKKIEEGSAIFMKSTTTESSVTIKLSGFTITIILD